MEELVIVGGGIAGLSCLNALLDHHISPLLLEASVIGTPKMCGEFVAPPVIEVLKRWGVNPIQSIRHAQFFGTKKNVAFSFLRDAGGYSRQAAELDLAAHAYQRGAHIVEKSPIQNIIPASHNTPFILQLASGNTIQAREVIFATGQFLQPMKPSNYMGFKTHINQIICPETLLMYGLTGGYLGIVPVTAETSNVTCLIKRDVITQAGSCRKFFAQQFEKILSNPNGVHPNLCGLLHSNSRGLLHSNSRGLTTGPKDLTSKQDRWAPWSSHGDSDASHGNSNIINHVEILDWLEGPAPRFGLKTLPHWPGAYWIGDAYASFHPAIGYGFAHSVQSALLAADYYLKHDPTGYHQTLRQNLRTLRAMGQGMHQLLQKPRWVDATVRFAYPSIIHQLLTVLDY